MIVTVFRSRLRPNIATAELEAVGVRMYTLATSMPGFVSYSEYASADGESVTIVEFESAATQLAWRNHPEHVEAQRRGREEFFSTYRITICEAQRDLKFNVDG
jgi:heme-degrading monooxygenase HmoA